MEQNTRGMVILLEDTRAGIRKAMQLDFGFAKKFTEKVDIPIFTIDELVEFGNLMQKRWSAPLTRWGTCFVQSYQQYPKTGTCNHTGRGQGYCG